MGGSFLLEFEFDKNFWANLLWNLVDKLFVLVVLEIVDFFYGFSPAFVDQSDTIVGKFSLLTF